MNTRHFRTNQQQELRDALMQAGVELIQSRGFDQATIEAITSTVGVSKGTFYTYFQRKEDLVLAALYHLSSADSDYIKKRLQAANTVREQVCTYFELMCEWVQQHPTLTWIGSIEKLRRGATPEHGKDRMRNFLAHCLALGQQTGEVRIERSAANMALDLDGVFWIHFARWYHRDTQANLFDSVLPAVDVYLRGALSPHSTRYDDRDNESEDDPRA